MSGLEAYLAMVEGLGSCSRWKFIHFMHFHFVFIRPGSGKRLKLQRTFVRFWGFESIIWKSESTLGCSLESGWSAYEVGLGGQSPANIQVQIQVERMVIYCIFFICWGGVSPCYSDYSDLTLTSDLLGARCARCAPREPTRCPSSPSWEKTQNQWEEWGNVF